MYDIELTPEAIEDLELLRKFQQQRVVNEIEVQLSYEPAVETRNRKRLRPNEVAEWALRVGGFRVFYDVDVEVRRVKVEAVGRKKGNKLFLHGKEYEL
jgi:mRNA-degrading endonuclease RelE of RelBE toxin-antitoxin system